MENKNGFLSVFEIGKLLDVSKEVVNTWLRKGYIKYSLVGNLQKIRSKDLLEYLKKIGNSDYAMKEFAKDIEMYFKKKALAKKGSKVTFDVFSDEGEKRIVGYRPGKDNDPFTSDPFKDFEESEEAKKYINEAENQEERAKRFAEVKNYIKGTGKKPWGKQ